jgi:hypothetical protein
MQAQSNDVCYWSKKKKLLTSNPISLRFGEKERDAHMDIEAMSHNDWKWSKTLLAVLRRNWYYESTADQFSEFLRPHFISFLDSGIFKHCSVKFQVTAYA